VTGGGGWADNERMQEMLSQVYLLVYLVAYLLLEGGFTTGKGGGGGGASRGSLAPRVGLVAALLQLCCSPVARRV
jgi:hypothetical protein